MLMVENIDWVRGDADEHDVAELFNRIVDNRFLCRRVNPIFDIWSLATPVNEGVNTAITSLVSWQQQICCLLYILSRRAKKYFFTCTFRLLLD